MSPVDTINRKEHMAYKKKHVDRYDDWVLDGTLKAKLNYIETNVAMGMTQKQIALYLGISRKTLTRLKKSHQDLARSFEVGNENLKESLLQSIYKMAMGYVIEDERQEIEVVGKREPKKKIVKTKRSIPASFEAAKYMLMVRFGREFNDHKDQIEIQEKKMELIEENNIFVTREDENKVIKLSKKKGELKLKEMERKLYLQCNPDEADEDSEL